MARKLIYTVITGDYDTPNQCPDFLGWDYLLITDNPNINANGWPLKVVAESDGSCKLQRYLKINSHLLGYDLTIYIDGNMKLQADPQAIVDKYFKGGIALVQHPSRRCIIPEGDAIIELRKDTFENVRKQIGYYIAEGIPYNFGMWANGFLIRDGSLKDFEWSWWEEVKKFSHRDQLSMPYTIWKHNQAFSVIPWSTLTRYVTIHKHLPKK